MIAADPSLLCTTSGCGNLWSCNFGRRLCSECDRLRNLRGGPAAPPPRQAKLPMLPTLRDAVRPFIEPSDRDEVEF